MIVSFLIYKSLELKRTYNTEVKRQLEHSKEFEKDILTEEDIKHLPEPGLTRRKLSLLFYCIN
ncbi:hypothetical protein [Clostridium homopropionicum]|uniref:hypothetical protein n=1 Tax=Clostridium homopropionicum TaxID=36844 RepID=UPI000A9AFBE3|nr:hypothetical protein [Clostridium homopropionicum]